MLKPRSEQSSRGPRRGRRGAVVPMLGLGLVLIGCDPCGAAEEMMSELPKGEYVRQDGDPEWLAYAAQFHGHLGPWATAGVRLGAAGRRAVQASGHFDLEVTVEGPFEKPPKSCFLDGVQVGTGATLGKRNLHWVKGERVVVRVKNTRTGDEVEVRPAPALLEMVEGLKTPGGAAGTDEDPVEAMARRIARTAEGKLAEVKVAGKH